MRKLLTDIFLSLNGVATPNKVFITVNMRSYFSDEVIDAFLKTALSHEYKVFMLESKAYPTLEREKRWTVDADLCEF